MPGIDTLPPFRLGDFPTLGPALVAWAMREKMKVLDGKLAGKPFVPTPSQFRFICHFYRVFPQGHPNEGEFYHGAGAIRLSRGSLKSPLGAFIAVIDTLGPSRFSHWGPNGEPVGQRPSMALAQIAAVSEAQTDNTFKYILGWCSRDTELSQKYNLDPGKTQVFAPSMNGVAGGKIHILTSSSATVRGARPSLVIADECSEWTESNGGVKFADTIDDNATKVDGARVLYLMNTWAPNSGSVAEQLYDAWIDEQSGEYEVERPILYWSREADPGTDWEDPDDIAKALAYIYEECPWINQKQVLAKILSPKKSITSSMREFGNLIVSDLSSWVSKQDWDDCKQPHMSLQDGDAIAMFFDPSESDDASALVACRIRDGLVQPLWIYEPRVTGQPVDPAEADRQVRLAKQRYRVRGFFADVHPMEQLVKSEWPNRYGDELDIWASKDEPIAYDMRRKQLDFAQAAELTAAEIESGDLMHTGDPILSRHVYNTQRRPYREFISVGKGDRSKKIDGAVAMIGARLVRRLVLANADNREQFVPRRIR